MLARMQPQVWKTFVNRGEIVFWMATINPKPDTVILGQVTILPGQVTIHPVQQILILLKPPATLI